jgi:hypothetical protein
VTALCTGCREQEKSDAVMRFLARNRKSKLLASAIHCLSSDEFIVSISLLLSLFGKQFEDPQSI